MALKLYYISRSGPCRASQLALAALNIPIELCSINFCQGEHRTPEFEKKNPICTVPTLQDGDFYLWDSHAINAYLVNKYAETDDLYPKDPQKRALIDQRLNFDCGVLYANMKAVAMAVRTKTITTVTPEIVKKYEEAYDLVEKLLKGNKYAVGDNITIADFSFVSSLTTMEPLVPIDQQKFPLIVKYLDLCKSTIPKYKEVNEYGVKLFVESYEIWGFVFPTQKN